jgi:hypothetical protein
VKSQRLSEFAGIPFFCSCFCTFPNTLTTMFEKMYIFYYRVLANFSVYSLDTFLAQKNMIYQPKERLTGATNFSIFVTPVISKLKKHY